MRAFTAFFVLILTLLAFLIGYEVGLQETTEQATKDYEVANIMTTCCNNMVDNLGTDAEEIYYEYIDNLDASNLSITKEDIARYNSWH